ncbi:MAG: non-heme iron oxygenase ferredoxin subunit [Nitrosopumilaceae archaeon]
MSSEFVKVAETKDIPRGEMRAVDLANEGVCIINVDNNFYAMGNVCTHQGGPLNEGILDGYEVECPWHLAKFGIRTGNVLAPPAEKSVLGYDVKVEGNNILIRKRE